MKPESIMRYFLCYTICLIISCSQKRTTVIILDNDQVSTTARIRVTDAEGVYYSPEGHSHQFPVTSANHPVATEKDVLLDHDRRFAYVEDTFQLNLPTHKELQFQVVKGFEFEFFNASMSSEDISDTLVIQLKKEFEFGSDWYSGDVHVHYINPETALLEMKGEDLNVCNILISDFTIDQNEFRGMPEPISEKEHVVYYNQEYREAKLGHVNFLNLKNLIDPVKPERKHQYPLNTHASKEIRDYGGHISWAHFAAWPGLEAPLGAILNKIDAVELLCTIDPFQSPIFISDIVPELASNSGLRLWYRLLNCGLKIPLTAGTDKMNNQVTIGANRVYTKVDGAFSYDKWIQGLNRGETFITNSPLIRFSISDYSIGDKVEISKPTIFKVKAEVWSQLPVDRLEFISNGNVIKQFTVSEEKLPAVFEFDYKIDQSQWLAARVYQLKDNKAKVDFSLRRDRGGGTTKLNEYFGTLRPEVSFAHTSPVYFHYNGDPILVKADAIYYVKYLENAKEWLQKEGSFPNEDARDEVLETFQQAINGFTELSLSR